MTQKTVESGRSVRTETKLDAGWAVLVCFLLTSSLVFFFQHGGRDYFLLLQCLVVVWRGVVIVWSVETILSAGLGQFAI